MQSVIIPPESWVFDNLFFITIFARQNRQISFFNILDLRHFFVQRRYTNNNLIFRNILQIS